MKDEQSLPALAPALEMSAIGFHAPRRKGQGQRRRLDNALACAIRPIFAASRQTLRLPARDGGAASKRTPLWQEPGGPPQA